MASSDGRRRPITLDPDIDPWERQTGESAAQFAQFSTFLALGRARTLAETAKRLKRTPSHIRHIASTYQWQARADASDREDDRLFRAQQTEDRLRLARVHMGLGAEMLAKVRAALTALDAGGLKPLELARIAEVAMKLQNNALGLPETVVAVTAADAPTASMFAEVTGMSMPERRQLLNKAIEEMTRRAGAARAEGDDEDAGATLPAPRGPVVGGGGGGS